MAGLNDYLNQLNNDRARQQWQASQQYKQQFKNLNDLLNRMGAGNSSAGAQARAAAQRGVLGGLGRFPGAQQPMRRTLPVDPRTRIAEIDDELDIIRGVKPTPKGYKIDPRKAKQLMAERAELGKNLT